MQNPGALSSIPIPQSDLTGQSAPSGGSSPNFLEQLLPTAGAIGGGLLGTLTDPILGPLGSIGGAAGGSAIGQQIENNLTGDKQSTALAGGEGALGQGVGMGVGSLLGKLGSNLVAKGATQGAAQGIADEFPAGAISSAAKTKLNFGDSVDLANQAEQPVTGQGFVNMQKAGTGPNGILNNVLDAQVIHQGPVDLSNYMQEAEDAVNSHTELSPQVRTDTLNKLRNMFQGTGLDEQGSIDESHVDANGALATLRKVGSQIAPYAGSETGTTGAALEDIYRKAYGSLASSIYDRPALNEAISGIQGITPETMLQSPSGNQVSLLDAAGGDQKLAQFYSDQLNNATSGRDITGLESKLMDMGSAGQKAVDYRNNVAKFMPPEAPAKGGGLLSRLGGLVGPRGAELGGIAEATLGGHPAVGLPIAALGAAADNPGATGSVLNGVANSGMVTPAAQLATHLPSVTPTANQTNNGGGMSPFQTTGAPNNNAAMTWAALFDPQAVPSMRASQAAQPILNSLESQYGAAGGGQGAGGILSALSGLVPGTAANNYNKARLQAAAQISQATGMPLQQVLASLPSIMSGQQGAATNFGGLQGELSALQTPGAGGGSLLAGIGQ